MPSEYDDDLWALVPEHPGEPPEHLARFVASLGPADTALDLGCGDGRLSALVRAERLVLADVSGEALHRAARRLPGAETVPLVPDAPLPLADSVVDLVVSTETIEHVRDTQRFLSEARRVLRPGGTLALSTPAHGRLTALRMLARGLERELDPLSPHLRLYTHRSLAGLLAEMGFGVRSVRTERGTLLAVASR